MAIKREVLLQPHDCAAIEVLEDRLRGSTRLDVAAAFVTKTGVALFRAIELPPTVRLICRAGHGPTDPDAVEAAAEDLGMEVRLVIGQQASRFHPKLYQVTNADGLFVLSGSGNLTAGGLQTNTEQFEGFSAPAFSSEAIAHEKRFLELWGRGVPLVEVQSTSFWDAWLVQWAELKELQAQAKEMETALDAEVPTFQVSDNADREPGPRRWQQSVVLPEIVRVVAELSSVSDRFYTRDEIAKAFLGDETGASLVDQAIERGDKGPPLRTAGNMVDWLSARFDEGSWAAQLEQTRRHGTSGISGKSREVWAYRAGRK